MMRLLSMAELLTWTAVDLKTWCIEHKLNVSGKKETLSRHVYRAMTFRER